MDIQSRAISEPYLNYTLGGFPGNKQPLSFTSVAVADVQFWNAAYCKQSVAPNLHLLRMPTWNLTGNSDCGGSCIIPNRIHSLAGDCVLKCIALSCNPSNRIHGCGVHQCVDRNTWCCVNCGHR